MAIRKLTIVLSIGCLIVIIHLVTLYLETSSASRKSGQMPKLQKSYERSLMETSVARENIKKVRVLCWVMTMLKNLDSKTKYVKKTWGKRCDILLFFGSEGDDEFPVIGVNVTEGRSHLTEKTHEAFRYVYKHYMDKADWFLKADDDTYVLVDNLKQYLSGLNTSEGLHLGFTAVGVTQKGFNSGGAGYVLSKEALRRFGTRGWDKRICPYKGGTEDADMSRCMYHLGVNIVNALDEKNRTRFHSHHPLTHIYSSDNFISTRSMGGYKTGAQNISDLPFTFHYVKGKSLELFEFLLYHVRHISSEGTVLS